MMFPAIRFSKVSKRIGQTLILQDLEMEVAQGSLVGLAGVNGAGKTTLIKCLLDFCHLDGGEIELFGLSHRRHQARAKLTFLPERFVPPYFLSGREFLHALRAMTRTPYNEQTVREYLHVMNLEVAVLDKPSRHLSKGTTQKLGLIACLMSGKDLYVLDEPMSGLDPQARAKVKTLLLGLKEQGKTTLFTSHSLADIEEICDHTLVLHQGSLAFSGAPHRLCERFEEPTLERAFLRCIGSDG